jgi:hypothetical protein
MPASAQSDLLSSLSSVPGSPAPSEEEPQEPGSPAAAAKLRDVEAEDDDAGDEIVDGEAKVYEASLSSPEQPCAHEASDSPDEQPSVSKTDRSAGVGKAQKSKPKPARPQTDPASRSSGRETQQNPGQSLDGVKRDIVQSYLDCGLEESMVQFAAVPQPFDPTTITIKSNRIRNAKLTSQSMEKLRAKRDKLLRQHWIMSPDSVGNRSADERDIGLIRKLCNLSTSHAEGPGVVSAMHKFCKEGNITQDETKLIEFWKWSVLIVGHQEDAHEEVGRSFNNSCRYGSANDVQYNAVVYAFEKAKDEIEKTEERRKGGRVRSEAHRLELLGLCSCLHLILFHLDGCWRGLHHMVLVRLRKWTRSRAFGVCVLTSRSPIRNQGLVGLFRSYYPSRGDPSAIRAP